MTGPKKPAFRLPDHLRRAKSPESARPTVGKTEGKTGQKPEKKPEAPPAAAPDRIGSLLPELLRAMIPAGRFEGRVVIAQEDVLAALAPYHRPKSRFEGLVIRRLVGEGHLKPLGARDKHGLSASYELTPKGAKFIAEKSS